MNPRIPWLPSEAQPGQETQPCPACGARALIPWILRRDPGRVVVLRTWICLECQTAEERPEPE